MEVRVVCGFEATMASLVPSSAFSRVDLPALGRPRMATNPARWVIWDYRLHVAPLFATRT